MSTLRRLIVLRHAKSAWNSDAPSDHARPLNKRGRRDAPRMAAHLARLGWGPEWVALSDAARTRETWARMKSAFAAPAQVVITHQLYHAGLDEVCAVLASVSAATTTVMVIGHNPGWAQLASDLSGREVMMTTCNAALLTTEADTWSAALAHLGGWSLTALLRPKEL